jgi:hypothetical protein
VTVLKEEEFCNEILEAGGCDEVAVGEKANLADSLQQNDFFSRLDSL